MSASSCIVKIAVSSARVGGETVSCDIHGEMDVTRAFAFNWAFNCFSLFLNPLLRL